MPSRNKKNTKMQNLALHGHTARILREAIDRAAMSQMEVGKAIAPDLKAHSNMLTPWVTARSQIPEQYRQPLADLLDIDIADLAPRELRQPPAEKPAKPIAITSTQNHRIGRVSTPSTIPFIQNPLSFTVTPEGKAVLALHIETSIQKGQALLRLLLDAGGLLDGENQRSAE